MALRNWYSPADTILEVVVSIEVVSTPQTDIATKVSLEVLESKRGRPHYSLTLPGGSIGGQMLHVNAVPNFEIGEQVILSLKAKRMAPLIFWWAVPAAN